MTRRRVVIGMAALILVVAYLIFYKDVAIAYHRRAMMRDYAKYLEVRPNGVQWIYSYEYHRERLVDYGYLARREFALVVKPPENYRVWKQLMKEFPDSIHTTMTETIIIVIDRPDRIPAWEAAIRKYDVPSSRGQTTRPLLPMKT